jgi:hypothetical protein
MIGLIRTITKQELRQGAEHDDRQTLPRHEVKDSDLFRFYSRTVFLPLSLYCYYIG